MTETMMPKKMSLVFSEIKLHHIGFAFIWACSMLTHRNSILLGEALLSNEFQMVLVFASFAANIATLFFISSRIERNPQYFNKLKPGLFVMLILLGFAILTLTNYFASRQLLTEGVLFGLLIGGASLTGCGYGYFWGSWAEYYGRIHPSRSLAYLPLVLLLSSVLYVAISLLHTMLNLPALLLMIPLPIITWFYLKSTLREVSNTPINRGEKNYRAAMGSLLVLIPSGIVLSFLFGLMWQMAIGEVGSTQSAHRIPMITNIVVAIVLLGVVAFAHRRVDLTVIFRVLIPITIVLFVLVPFFWESNPIFLYTIMSATHGILDLIIWCMVAAAAYDYAVSGFVVGSLIRGLAIASRLAGIGLGHALTLLDDSFPILLIGISITAIYTLMMLFVFQSSRFKFSFFANEATNSDQEALEQSTTTSHQVRRHSQRTDLPKENTNLNENPLFSTNEKKITLSAKRNTSSIKIRNMKYIEAKQSNLTDRSTISNSAAQMAPEEDTVLLGRIADTYGFTRREREVFAYLAKGRSAKVIAEALIVSENTIRTHTRKILEKTDLHSKQALIDLIDTYDG